MSSSVTAIYALFVVLNELRLKPSLAIITLKIAKNTTNATMNIERPARIVFFLPNFLPILPAGIAAAAEQTAKIAIRIVAWLVAKWRISAAKRAKKVVIAFVPQKRKKSPISINTRLFLSPFESFCAFICAFSSFLACFSAAALAFSSIAIFCSATALRRLSGSLTLNRTTSIPISITTEPVKKT